MENQATLLAIVKIRNLVLGLSNDWEELRTNGAAIDADIEKVSRLFINNAASSIHERWLIELGEVRQNVTMLKEILRQVITKINARESDQLSTLWEGHKAFSSSLSERFKVMQDLGQVHLDESFESEWKERWLIIQNQFYKNLELAKASQLHLSMIEEYTPDEINTLTEAILRHMPKNYTEKEAVQYEAEYMEAYAQLKEEASQKKNLWDRFLDILAGGAQQTPAQMVMMKRWVDGEKGDL